MRHSLTVEGDESVLQVHGELDAMSCPALQPVLDSLVQDARQGVRVDLSRLRMIDSFGVAALVSLDRGVRDRGSAVRFMGVVGQPLVIFKVLRLDRTFQLVTSFDIPRDCVAELDPAKLCN